MLILISWLLEKPADLDPHCFQKRLLAFDKVNCMALSGELQYCNFRAISLLMFLFDCVCFFVSQICLYLTGCVMVTCWSM